MRIDFIENKYGHLAVSTRYLLMSFKHFGLGVSDLARLFHERVIKRYPLIVIVVVILVSVIFSFVQIGKARTERDNYSRSLYLANKKIEMLENR